MSKNQETKDVGLFGEDPFGEEEATESATEAAAGDDPHLDSEALAEIREAREEVRRCEAEYLDRKERAKEAKEAWETAVAELTATIDRVTRPLPLFDRPAEAEEEDDTPAGLDWPAEAVATMRVRLTTEIATGEDGDVYSYGKAGEVVQVFVDTDGDAFLARRPWEEAYYIYLEAGEYEEIEGEGQSRQEAETALAASQGDAAPVADTWRAAWVGSLGVSASVVAKLAKVGIETLGQLSDWMQKHGEFWAKDIPGIGEAKATEIADRFAAYWEKHPEHCR